MGSPEHAPRDAGFWLRLAAWLIDGVVTLPLAFAGWALALQASTPWQAAAVAAAMLAMPWLYFAITEGSRWQATVGKLALGLRVVQSEGRTIGFGRSSARTFAKALSAAPLLLGFALAGVTRRKQALHDLIASTRVVSVRSGRAWLAAATVLVAAALLVAGMVAAVNELERRRYRQITEAAVRRLSALAQAEQELFERDGAYQPITLPAAGVPGKQRRPWSQAEREQAAAIGWHPVDDDHPASYFTYRLVVGSTGAGTPTWAACAEGDLDGDGVMQAIIAFQPALDASGGEGAPPAPCTHSPRLELPLSYQGRTGPLRAGPKDVF
jgi:uncharacterized RDD family membrane protein YckC